MGFAFEGFDSTIYKVIIAVLPLVIVAIVAQLLLLKLPPDEMKRIALGLVFSMIGLSFFLQGVEIGFMPAGEHIGATLGGSRSAWLLVPLGIWLGIVAAIAEPSVLVLADEVEKVSSGSISKRFLVSVLAVGVGLLVGIAMLRVLYDIPLMAILLPGYLLVFLMIPYVSTAFTPIAFDAGVVATGPITVTFVLGISLGAAGALGRDPVISGFGLVSFVAMAPILSIMFVGVLLQRQQRRQEAKEAALAEADNSES